MYTNLVIYRNELKNKSIPRYKLIGIVVELLFSKKIFPKNSDIAKFSNNILNLELKNYILKSRTMIVAKACRNIKSIDNITLLQKSLSKFINEQIELFKDNEKNKQSKNDFDGWIE